MNNRLLKTNHSATLMFVILMTLSPISAFAQDPAQDEQSKVQAQEDSPARQNEKRLEGVWDGQVTIRDCQTGAALRTFPSIITYMPGGTWIESNAGTPQSLKTPGQGVWRYIGGNTYHIKAKFFNFDVNNNFVGWAIITHELTLNRRADEGESAGTVEIHAPNGNLIVTACSTATATRFQ